MEMKSVASIYPMDHPEFILSNFIKFIGLKTACLTNDFKLSN